jgi:hypothetical protein
MGLAERLAAALILVESFAGNSGIGFGFFDVKSVGWSTIILMSTLNPAFLIPFGVPGFFLSENPVSVL